MENFNLLFIASTKTGNFLIVEFLLRYNNVRNIYEKIIIILNNLSEISEVTKQGKLLATMKFVLKNYANCLKDVLIKSMEINSLNQL